mmetsp:Transcript_7310/g.23014  ORF Transcript_7310/g.23014 Transcript_7310/m.23014 type:complete len:402 (+) Transcript_7310:742-1947(+)
MVRMQDHHRLVGEPLRVQLRQHPAYLRVNPGHRGSVVEPPLARGAVVYGDVGAALRTRVVVGDWRDRHVQRGVQGHVNLILRREQGQHRLGEAEVQVGLPEASRQEEWLARVPPVLGREAELHHRVVGDHPVAELPGRAGMADDALRCRIHWTVAPWPHLAAPHPGDVVDPLHGEPLAPAWRVLVRRHARPVPGGVLTARGPLLRVEDLPGGERKPAVPLEVLRQRGPGGAGAEGAPKAANRPLFAEDAAWIGLELAGAVRVGVRPRLAAIVLRADGAALPTASAGSIAPPLAPEDLHLAQRGPGVCLTAPREAAVGLPEVVNEVVDAGVVRPPAREEGVPGGGADGDLAVGVVEDRARVCKPLHVRRVVGGPCLAIRLQLRPQVVHEDVEQVPGPRGCRP